MFLDYPILSFIIWFPLLGACLVLATSKLRPIFIKLLALSISTITFIASIPLYLNFSLITSEMQYIEKYSWIPSLNVYYYLGIDGISLPLILLTTFLTPFVILSGWQVIKYKPSQYFASFLILEALMIGVFSALDGLLFYIFWEAMLIPMFIIIGVWGGDNRIYATIKFFLYTFLGSVFMLIALIYMYLKSGSYSILDFHHLSLSFNEQIFIFLAFLFAFAVKVPMWPVHTWLPDAHVQAPTGGSVILAAILLKMGGYGFLRFSLPITPDASHSLDWLLILLSMFAIIYIALVALVQKDMKKLIAYSSITHMGFVTLGFFIVFMIMDNYSSSTAALMSLQGAMVQMISHGFISGALFLCVGVLYDRMHSREISSYGGVANTMPKFAAFMLFFALANVGLPGTSGFVGEFLVIIASYHANFWIAFLAATSLIFGAAYTLWLVKRVLFGEVANEEVASLEDINPREWFILSALAFLVLLFGIWPAPLVDIMEVTLLNLLDHISISKL
ncbi:MAG: NADH-quinone oxidoreductase subunit M [Gammaproteobacteria bacterium TMED78]|nr:MAG: NADH-quinone oxidoreductase subunit M [Gammaproteobacteria bacterium TMED78]|tara:strand:- start:1892 stop:3406 length:1515 start_codon:yes stop_codon:yes gene_type:complete